MALLRINPAIGRIRKRNKRAGQIEQPDPLILSWLFDLNQPDDGWDDEYQSDCETPTLDTAVYVLNHWAELVAHLEPAKHNKILWRLIGNPLFLGICLKSNNILFERACQIIDGFVTVSESIPEVHEMTAPMENGYYMIWDALVDGITEPRMLDYALEALKRLLIGNDRRVVYAALHGLGHLDHPDRAKVIMNSREWKISENDPNYRLWITECRDGKVL